MKEQYTAQAVRQYLGTHTTYPWPTAGRDAGTNIITLAYLLGWCFACVRYSVPNVVSGWMYFEAVDEALLQRFPYT